MPQHWSQPYGYLDSILTILTHNHNRTDELIWLHQKVKPNCCYFKLLCLHGPLCDNLRGICLCLISGVCGVYCAFRGGATFQMRKSTDVLTSHCSHTSSVPLALSSSATLHVPIHIHLWTTVGSSGPVWSQCRGTGIADLADHVRPV